VLKVLLYTIQGRRASLSHLPLAISFRAFGAHTVFATRYRVTLLTATHSELMTQVFRPNPRLRWLRHSPGGN